MEPMPVLAPFLGAQRHEVTPGERRVENHADPADSEGEYEAFDVEARALSELEQAGRIPVAGDEQRLGDAVAP